MGGGGSSPGGYQPEYYAYDHSPDPYRGQNEINQAAASINANSDRTIQSRIIPNMTNIDYYRLVNRLHLEATEVINDQTNAYIEQYPQFVLNKIITIEEAYQRINDYIQFFQSFDRGEFKATLEKHKQWFAKTRDALCALINRADYYKRRLTIKKGIEAAIIEKRRTYLENAGSTAETPIPFEFVIPNNLAKDNNFNISYINELAETNTPSTRFRLYMSLPPPQTGDV
jgi:hypothetical protein